MLTIERSGQDRGIFAARTSAQVDVGIREAWQHIAVELPNVFVGALVGRVQILTIETVARVAGAEGRHLRLAQRQDARVPRHAAARQSSADRSGSNEPELK